MKDKYDYKYIAEVVQRGRICPARYRHRLKIPYPVYEELCDNKILLPHTFFAEDNVFYMFTEKYVILCFESIKICNDVHIRILSFLVSKAYSGINPIIRDGMMF